MSNEKMQALELESMEKQNELLVLQIEKKKLALEIDKIILEMRKKELKQAK